VYRSAVQLWASDARYMNDSMELVFGAEVFNERFARARASAPKLADLFFALQGAFAGDSVFEWAYGLRCFAICLCTNGDLLSQWRGYAGGTGGFAIGFPAEIVSRACAFHPQSTAMGTTPFPMNLRPVEYGRAAVEDLANQFIRTIQTDFEAGRLIAASGGQRIEPSFVASRAFRELSVVKHEAFREEQEWRLSASNEPQYPVRIRPRRAGLLPYLETVLNMDTDNFSPVEQPIVDLVVGPGPDQAGQVAAAKELLKIRRFNPDVVRASSAPFRG